MMKLPLSFNIHLTTPSPDTEIVFIPEKFPEQEPTHPSKHFNVPQPCKPSFKKYGLLEKNIKIFRQPVDKTNYELKEKLYASIEKVGIKQI